MIVYLLRHGTAEDLKHPGADAERRLTEKGTLRTALVAKSLMKLGVTFDRIIASPYDRARQTAEITARITEHREEIRFDTRLAPNARFADTDELLKENADVEHLLLVGHQPNLGIVAEALCSGGRLALEIRKCSVTAIELIRFRPQSQGKLLWHLPPKLLERLLG